MISGENLTCTFLPNNFLLIPRRYGQEMDMAAIDLTEVKTGSTVYRTYELAYLYRCAFALPRLRDRWELNHLEIRYSPQPSSLSTKGPRVPFRTIPDGDKVILLDIGILGGGQLDVMFRFFIHAPAITQHIQTISPGANAGILPWRLWGPRNCATRSRGSEDFDVISTDWPRNLFTTRYVEVGFLFADFSQVKYRKSLSGRDSATKNAILPRHSTSSDDILSTAVPFLDLLDTTLPCRWKRFSLYRNGEVFERGALICEDAIVIPQASVRPILPDVSVYAHSFCTCSLIALQLNFAC